MLLNTVVLTQAWKRLRFERRQGFEASWHNHAHTTLGLLRRNLKKLGFIEQAPWLWRVPRPWHSEVPPSEKTLDLRDCQRQPQDMQLHVIRAQARRGWFEDYLDSRRHETEEMLGNFSRPQLRKYFLDVDLKKTRQVLSFGPQYRAACLASAFSPMHLKAAGKAGETGACPFCGHEVGSWAHVTWLCNNKSCEEDTPENPFAKRLGWITHGSGACASHHLAKTIARLWEHRHGSVHPRGFNC